MLNDSSLSTILFRIEHLFDGQLSPTQKSLEINTQHLFHHSPSDDVLPNVGLSDNITDDLDRYLLNADYLSDSSHTSSPSMPPSSVLSIQASSSQFEFILNAPTASLAKINEETATYLNQGQPYEIKFCVTNHSPSENSLPITYRSILRLCFWDKALQTQERELLQKWINEYGLTSLFDIDMNLTYGILSIIRSREIPNAVEIVWDAAATASLFIRFKCTSTDFANKRHGGEKGILLRMQIDTYHENDIDDIKHLHSCYCKIQLFRLKGAQRKNKADQIRIDKMDSDQRRRYQTTVEYTLLKPCSISPLYTLNLLSLTYSPDDLSDVCTHSTPTTNQILIPKKDPELVQEKLDHTTGLLSPSLPDIKYTSSELFNQEGNQGIKITVQSSNQDVSNWLKTNNFTLVLNRFEHYAGIDLLRLSFNEVHRICNGDAAISIRLYNQLNQTTVPPLKILYIKTTNTDIYCAIYLQTLTRRELLEKLFQLIQQTPQEKCHLVLELSKIKIRIDNDNVVKYSIPDGSQFYLKTLPHVITLCLIGSSS